MDSAKKPANVWIRAIAEYYKRNPDKKREIPTKPKSGEKPSELYKAITDIMLELKGGNTVPTNEEVPARADTSAPIKRGRGRPRKVVVDSPVPVVKKPVGRPRKVPVLQQEESAVSPVEEVKMKKLGRPAKVQNDKPVVATVMPVVEKAPTAAVARATKKCLDSETVDQVVRNALNSMITVIADVTVKRMMDHKKAMKSTKLNYGNVLNMNVPRLKRNEGVAGFFDKVLKKPLDMLMDLSEEMQKGTIKSGFDISDIGANRVERKRYGKMEMIGTSAINNIAINESVVSAVVSAMIGKNMYNMVLVYNPENMETPVQITKVFDKDGNDIEISKDDMDVITKAARDYVIDAAVDDDSTIYEQL